MLSRGIVADNWQHLGNLHLGELFAINRGFARWQGHGLWGHGYFYAQRHALDSDTNANNKDPQKGN